MNNIEQISKEFQTGIDMMWKAHEEIGHVWKLPNQLVCVMYAATECTEVLNSLTEVVDNQGHYRNNPKDRNTKEEIGDTIMMLGRFFMSLDTKPDFDWIGTYDNIPDNNYLDIVLRIAEVLRNISTFIMEYEYDYIQFLEMAIYLLFTLLDEGEYIRLLEKKLNKYRTKILGTV